MRGSATQKHEAARRSPADFLYKYAAAAARARFMNERAATSSPRADCGASILTNNNTNSAVTCEKYLSSSRRARTDDINLTRFHAACSLKEARASKGCNRALPALKAASLNGAAYFAARQWKASARPRWIALTRSLARICYFCAMPRQRICSLGGGKGIGFTDDVCQWDKKGYIQLLHQGTRIGRCQNFVGCLGFVMHLLSVGKYAAPKGATFLKQIRTKACKQIISLQIICILKNWSL